MPSPGCSYYRINFHQRVQRATTERIIGSEESEILLDSASKITSLVEEISVEWETFLFPMICLRRFEETYSLAGWVFGLFMRVVYNSTHIPSPFAQKEVPKSFNTVSSGIQHDPSLDQVLESPRALGPVRIASGNQFSQPPDGIEPPPSLFTDQTPQTRLVSQDSITTTSVPIALSRFGNELLHALEEQPPWNSSDLCNGYSYRPQHFQPQTGQNDGFIDSMHFEAFQYLADLGMGGFSDYGWDIPDLLNQG
ncbi:hypothetical protein N7474_004442 [Penicillium riverlandense]|uniref:uncharacterized protein n=1 Tax=Penicillium riverlandense TaxID=1903569 RepID=UPI0025491041|nr:uncharacterized protein N7474_004442 [Penicillium riverlandense]KAJ5818851.1 hypothetical protein N7474_004442 [Penicillium riverlandense]